MDFEHFREYNFSVSTIVTAFMPDQTVMTDYSCTKVDNNIVKHIDCIKVLVRQVHYNGYTETGIQRPVKVLLF